MKKIIFLTIVLIFVFSISVCANHIPVLLYHDLQTEYEASKDGVVITPQMFEEHISTLLDNGYTPVSFTDVYKATEGLYALPEKPVIISFDDGYLTNYTYAFPIIQKYAVKSTIFVVTSTVGRETGNPHFTWEQAKIMQQSGLVSIQSHTHNHYDVLTLDSYNAQRELRMSKYMVEKNLGSDCNVLAFPFGSCNEVVVSSAFNAGYKMVARVGETGKNDRANIKTTPFVRITVYGSWMGDDLVRMIDELSNQ